MKIYSILCIAVAVIMLLTPLASISFRNTDEEYDTDASGETVTQIAATEDDTISVFMSAQEKTEEMDMRDYIIGTVAAEMPASYETEALKAQALAAVTYAEYLKKNGSNEETGGAVISDDSSTHQGYMTKDEMREKWGDAFDVYYNKIADAVDDVIDKVITYENQPVMAAYHAISTGYTESAENLWGEAVPYLVSVESEGDRYSSRYSTTVTLTEDELRQILQENNVKCDSDNDEIKINHVTDSGTVTEITVFGKEMTGMELRTLLAMRSPSFDVECEDGVYTFSVKGYGHGVGMSQYGADWYAKQGYSYEEIIGHYYTGTQISER